MSPHFGQQSWSKIPIFFLRDRVFANPAVNLFTSFCAPLR